MIFLRTNPADPYKLVRQWMIVHQHSFSSDLETVITTFLVRLSSTTPPLSLHAHSVGNLGIAQITDCLGLYVWMYMNVCNNICLMALCKVA